MIELFTKYEKFETFCTEAEITQMVEYFSEKGCIKIDRFVSHFKDVMKENKLKKIVTDKGIHKGPIRQKQKAGEVKTATVTVKTRDVKAIILDVAKAFNY